LNDIDIIEGLVQESEIFHLELMDDAQKMFNLQLKDNKNLNEIKYSKNFQYLEKGLVETGYELTKIMIIGNSNQSKGEIPTTDNNKGNFQ